MTKKAEHTTANTKAYQLILKNGLLVAMLNEKGTLIAPKQAIRK
jgi:hypothetical protein